MDYKNVMELMQKFSDLNITSLDIDCEELKISLKKEIYQYERETSIKTKNQAETLSTVIISETKTDILDDPNIKLIKSPIVGTFYAAPSPEAKPYVSVGDRVKKGQTLCIIEAMKLMNEIESEFDGVITEILCSNGQMVEYGQALFKIRI